MADATPTLMIVGQSGRLAAEAVLFAASLRAAHGETPPHLVVAEPQAGPLWPSEPGLGAESRACLDWLGADVRPFESRVFGASYPNANKAEGLYALPKGHPFVFFDTDTLVTAPLPLQALARHRPTASARVRGTWPVIEPYGPGLAEIWGALYDRFGLDIGPTLDPAQPVAHWRHYLYLNAGWFTGPCPHAFADLYVETMRRIRDDPPPELDGQPLYPWLDQIALPLVIHALGGGRPGPELDSLDADATLHYRALPLLYATAEDATVSLLETLTAPNRVKRALKAYEPWKRILYQGRGARARALFPRDARPTDDRTAKNRLRREKLWAR